MMYVDKYRHDALFVDEDMFAIQSLAREWALEKYGIVTAGQLIREHMIMPFFDYRWLNWGFRVALLNRGIRAPLLEEGFNPPVLFLAIKKRLKCPQCLEAHASEIVFQNGAYAFLRTRFRAQDFVQRSFNDFSNRQSEILRTYYGIY